MNDRQPSPQQAPVILFFEDFEPGTVFDLGSRALSKEEMIAFAREFDPQTFHTEEAAAAGSPFGGLVASGWHTAAIFMRLYVDSLLSRAASIASPGVDELRWRKPVRPGDTLHARVTVLDATPSHRDPGRGTVRLRAEARNQRGEEVMTFTGLVLFARRQISRS